MRAAISHFISSLVFSSLAINSKALLINFPRLLLLASSAFSRLAAVNAKLNPHEPEGPVPHRGSGRRESVQYSVMYATV
jgi:hypothetical protein